MEKYIGESEEIGENIFTQISITDGWTTESNGTASMTISYDCLNTTTITGWEIKYILRRFPLVESLAEDTPAENSEMSYCYSYANIKRCTPEKILLRLCSEKEIIDYVVEILTNHRAEEIKKKSFELVPGSTIYTNPK